MSFLAARRSLVLVVAAAALLALLFVLQRASGGSASRLPSSATLRPRIPTAKPAGHTRSTLGWASSNWSGYAVTPTGNTSYSDVTGNWSVPEVTGPCSDKRYGCYSSAWTGIDGFTNSSLIQTGTEQDYVNGSASYFAWWTTSAQGFAPQVINGGCSGGSRNCGTVSPSDAMSARITQTSGFNWTITLIDSTQHWTFTTPTTYTGPGASAEWIMEAPSFSNGHVATLSTYNPFTFDSATVNGGSPNLAPSDGGVLIQKGKVVSIPSSPDAENDGFAMAYGSSAPSPP